MGERIIELAALSAGTIAAVVLTDLLLSLALTAVRLLAEKPQSIPRPRDGAAVGARAAAARAAAARTESGA